jgi:hypothetical protein
MKTEQKQQLAALFDKIIEMDEKINNLTKLVAKLCLLTDTDNQMSNKLIVHEEKQILTLG